MANMLAHRLLDSSECNSGYKRRRERFNRLDVKPSLVKWQMDLVDIYSFVIFSLLLKQDIFVNLNSTILFKTNQIHYEFESVLMLPTTLKIAENSSDMGAWKSILTLKTWSMTYKTWQPEPNWNQSSACPVFPYGLFLALHESPSPKNFASEYCRDGKSSKLMRLTSKRTRGRNLYPQVWNYHREMPERCWTPTTAVSNWDAHDPNTIRWTEETAGILVRITCGSRKSYDKPAGKAFLNFHLSYYSGCTWMAPGLRYKRTTTRYVWYWFWGMNQASFPDCDFHYSLLSTT